MHAQNNLTAPYTVLRAGLYMVQSSPSVVAISVNGFTMDDGTITVMQTIVNYSWQYTLKVKVFQGSYVFTKISYLELFYQ